MQKNKKNKILKRKCVKKKRALNKTKGNKNMALQKTIITFGITRASTFIQEVKDRVVVTLIKTTKK
jgi:hypothetical protein